MSQSTLDRLVAATLYEGYILYPYRPSSVKNRVRWTFGGVHPRAWSEASGGTDPWTAQTQCLLRGSDATRVTVRVRFLQLVTRTVAKLDPPGDTLDAEAVGRLEEVAELRVAGVNHRGWEEATEISIDCGTHALPSLLEREVVSDHIWPAHEEVEPLLDAGGLVAGVLQRERQPLAAEVTVTAEPAGNDLVRVSVVVRNASAFRVDGTHDRERALRSSLVSTHAILIAEEGEWLSLADPPADAVDAAAACRNLGLWPVLVGDPADSDTILASPIILEDHPQVAPESSGDLFDATEIDEILSLRILALTDDEKAEMRAADGRARALLDRTEALTGDDMMRLHGTIREIKPVIGDRR
ncbi:MAG: hypothetical protein WB808_11820 [Candidatus Dormiibacterota bacterium]